MSMLQEARKIAERLNKKDFQGTLSWLEGVKKDTIFVIIKIQRLGRRSQMMLQSKWKSFEIS